MTDQSIKQGYPSFEPPKLNATDIFELNVDPAIIDFSEETLKALVMPSKRPAAILQHLERQAEALNAMRAKIRDQLTRCQVEEQFMKKKLSMAPLHRDDDLMDSPASMDVDLPTTMPIPSIPTLQKNIETKKALEIPSDDEEDEEDDEFEPLPDSLKQSLYGRDSDDEDDFEDDDDDYASMEMRRILASKR